MSKAQEQIDVTLYNIICDIWNAYRTASKLENAKEFNDVFMNLHDEYEYSDKFKGFIQNFGMALAPFVNEAVGSI